MKTTLWISTLVVLLLLAACGPDERKSVPDELLGKWVTDSGPYQDRFFTLDRQSVVFGTGENEFTAHAVRMVKVSKEKARNCYVIHYQGDDKQEFAWPLCYDPASGEIRVKNQPEIAWKKTPS